MREQQVLHLPSLRPPRGVSQGSQPYPVSAQHPKDWSNAGNLQFLHILLVALSKVWGFGLVFIFFSKTSCRKVAAINWQLILHWWQACGGDKAGQGGQSWGQCRPRRAPLLGRRRCETTCEVSEAGHGSSSSPAVVGATGKTWVGGKAALFTVAGEGNHPQSPKRCSFVGFVVPPVVYESPRRCGWGSQRGGGCLAGNM